MMKRHAAIIELGIKLGYFKNELGVCRGFTSAWMEACLINEEEVFNKRVDRILQSSSRSLISQIDHVKEKVKNRQLLTADDKEQLDILSFFEKIALYQSPEDHKYLFDETLHQTDQDRIAAIIQSDDITAAGGVITLTDITDMYTKQKLKKFLDDIAKAITSVEDADKKIGLMFGTNTHAMGLMFELHDGKPCWRFMDINSEKSILSNNIDSIIDYVSENYYKGDDIFRMDISTVTTNNFPHKQQLTTELNAIQQDAAKEKVSESIADEFRSIYRALTIGNIESIKSHPFDKVSEALSDMMQTYVHPNSLIYALKHGYSPESIILQAARLDLSAVIHQAVELGIDIDIELYINPLVIAAATGGAKCVTAFHDNDIPLNRLYEGANLAHIAAKYGHANVLAVLAKYYPELLIQEDKNGDTPAMIAALNSREEALHELSKYIRLDQQTTPTGRTLLFEAAKAGHSHLIPFLISYHIDPDMKNDTGESAAHVAAYYGKDACLEQLAKCGANLILANNNGKTPLDLAVMPLRVMKP